MKLTPEQLKTFKTILAAPQKLDPEKWPCPECGGQLTRIVGLKFMGPWAGRLTCGSCDWTSSASSYIVKKAFVATPLTPDEILARADQQDTT